MATVENTTEQTTASATPAAKVPVAPQKEEGKWTRRAKTVGKWTGLGILAAGIGAGGYFAAQAYTNRS